MQAEKNRHGNAGIDEVIHAGDVRVHEIHHHQCRGGGQRYKGYAKQSLHHQTQQKQLDVDVRRSVETGSDLDAPG